MKFYTRCVENFSLFLAVIEFGKFVNLIITFGVVIAKN